MLVLIKFRYITQH